VEVLTWRAGKGGPTRTIGAQGTYPNAYPNGNRFGGIRRCSSTLARQSDVRKRYLGEPGRTARVSLGVKGSQVQILSARPKGGEGSGPVCGVGQGKAAGAGKVFAARNNSAKWRWPLFLVIEVAMVCILAYSRVAIVLITLEGDGYREHEHSFRSGSNPPASVPTSTPFRGLSSPC